MNGSNNKTAPFETFIYVCSDHICGSTVTQTNHLQDPPTRQTVVFEYLKTTKYAPYNLMA